MNKHCTQCDLEYTATVQPLHSQQFCDKVCLKIFLQEADKKERVHGEASTAWLSTDGVNRY